MLCTLVLASCSSLSKMSGKPAGTLWNTGYIGIVAQQSNMGGRHVMLITGDVGVHAQQKVGIDECWSRNVCHRA